MAREKIIMATLNVTKSELTSNMQEYLRRVETAGDELIVTSRKKPVFIIKPFQPKQPVDAVFAPYRGKVRYAGDILEPEIQEWAET